jgi:hypothetical protein
LVTIGEFAAFNHAWEQGMRRVTPCGPARAATPPACGRTPRQKCDDPSVDRPPRRGDARCVADHQTFALMLLRQIVGAHRALLQAEAAPEGERERAVLAARQRLGLLVQQASVQFPSPLGRQPDQAAVIADH